MTEETTPTIEQIIQKIKEHNKKINQDLILKAYHFAKDNHNDQLRKSGEPYMIHPTEVAYILADIGLNDSTVCAALLHDIIEDTDVTREQMEKEFGTEITEMVEGVTKLGKLKYVTAEEEQVENYRKMFLAMGKDIRVILIKLADRLHNMRTLKYIPRERQIINARETLDLYAPLANRLRNLSIKMGIGRFRI